MAPYQALDVPKQRPKEALGARRDSPKAAAPTIRVIHIFAPKVIQTDTANFRSTVQKLTGWSTKKRARVQAPKEVHPVDEVPLVRSDSGESLTYSSDAASDSFPGFYAPHRDSAYSLSEIPAPFFAADPQPCATSVDSMLGFDLDHLNPPADSDLPFLCLEFGAPRIGMIC